VVIGPPLSHNRRVTQGAPKLVNVQAEAHCRNCGGDLIGRYCHGCGQPADVELISLRRLLQEWLHEYLELDGKIVRTMRLLLLSPGRLTKEFLEGKRARYISPIRLYLVWSVAFFSLLSIVPQQQAPKPLREQPKVVGRLVPTGNPFLDRFHRAAIDIRKDSTPVVAKLTKWWPTVMFALVPVFGLLTWFACRKAVRGYLPHLYFAIHVHAFVFFAKFLSLLIRAVGLFVLRIPHSVVYPVISFALDLLVLPYVIVALHSVYEGTWPRAIFRGVTTLVGYVAVLFAAVTVVGIAAVLTLM
jgi:hypothetical protein